MVNNQLKNIKKRGFWLEEKTRNIKKYVLLFITKCIKTYFQHILNFQLRISFKFIQCIFPVLFPLVK